MNRKRASLVVSITFAGVALGFVPVKNLLLRVDDRLMASYQSLDPAGQTTVIATRPVDVVENRGLAWVKDSGGVGVYDPATLKAVARISTKGGASQTGILATNAGVLSTNSENLIFDLTLEDNKIKSKRTIELPAGSYPNGMAWTEPGKRFLVCLSLKNQIAEVDYVSGKIVRTIDVDVAPYQVAVLDGKAYVTCQGGVAPTANQKRAMSSGTPVAVDDSGHAVAGSLVALDLTSGAKQTFRTGRQPNVIRYLSRQGVFAISDGNDDAIEFFDPKQARIVGKTAVTLDPRLPFGAMPDGLAASADGTKLYVSLSGVDAVEVLDISRLDGVKPIGFVPTAWFPTGLAIIGDDLIVACAKGIGSRRAAPSAKGRNSHEQTGVVQRVPKSELSNLEPLTARARATGRIEEIVASRAVSNEKVEPRPVPSRLGEPSVFNHVVYVIKENRTYDQVFGDMPSGDGDPKLCVFPEPITPNHHAIAREFALLDNYYCNGVLSADGHSWNIEGVATPYLEHEFGGFARSYDYGTDAITYASSGFIWDPILAKGKTFRNFGELEYPDLPKGWKTTDVWRAYDHGDNTRFGQRVEIDRLRDYTARDFPGWEMAIPDVLRMDRFLKEFREWEKSGDMPNFVIVYLPQDHTAGTNPGYPKPASYLADNDLALGRLLDAISHSRFWKDTVLFANEDDPQAGYDHVDGHRSLCLVASPYTKRHQTVSEFYNQASVLHTILRIFGAAAMNQQIAMAPLMTACFTDQVDLTPYVARDPSVDRRKLNPPLSALTGSARKWAEASVKLGFKRPDFDSEAKDDLMGRIVWHAMKGDAPYPSDLVGGHGKGLSKRGLTLDREVKKGDD